MTKTRRLDFTSFSILVRCPYAGHKPANHTGLPGSLEGSLHKGSQTYEETNTWTQKCIRPQVVFSLLVTLVSASLFHFPQTQFPFSVADDDPPSYRNTYWLPSFIMFFKFSHTAGSSRTTETQFQIPERESGRLSLSQVHLPQLPQHGCKSPVREGAG